MIPEILQEFLSLSFTSFNTVNTRLCLLTLQVIYSIYLTQTLFSGQEL